VTLLDPDDHAAALTAMRRHGRKPMSMTHGDFDYEYLQRLAIGPDGLPRFDLLRFAGHFDSLMFGRRGHRRPADEAELNPARRAFVEAFERVRREHGVRHDLAHNMTVTPRNLDQVADVARSCMGMGFGMFSFQPAAHVGNPNRWREDYQTVTLDAVWTEIERGAGVRLPWRHLQMGDERCNRAAYGVLAGERWVPLLDDLDPRDLAVRDAFLLAFGGMDFDRPAWQVLLRCASVAVRRPAAVVAAVGWGTRFARRLGVSGLRRGRPRGLTFVVHAFMDASGRAGGWQAMEAGAIPEDLDVCAAVERLRACSYGMAHPDDGRIVPACVQHSVLDRRENEQLLTLLPTRGLAEEAPTPAGRAGSSPGIGDPRCSLRPDSVRFLRTVALSVGIQGPTAGVIVGPAVLAGIVAGAHSPTCSRWWRCRSSPTRSSLFTRSFNSCSSVYAFNGATLGARYGFVSVWMLLLVYVSFAAGVYASTADIAGALLASLGVHVGWVVLAVLSWALTMVFAYLSLGFSSLVILGCEGLAVGLIAVVGIAVLAHGGYHHRALSASPCVLLRT